MNFIESERLILHPLSARHLHWLIYDREKLEEALGLEKSELELSAPDSFLEQFIDEIKTIVIPSVQKYADQYMWYMHWIIIHKKFKHIIGGIGIQGEPDKTGTISLRFYIDIKYEGKGLASEAVGCLTGWLQQSTKVLAIEAETPADHISAQKVLKKNGYKVKNQVENIIEWIYKKQEIEKSTI